MTPGLSLSTRVVATSCLVVMLASCAWLPEMPKLKDKSDDYLEAKPGRSELLIPEELDTGVVKNGYPIPEIESRPLAKTYPTRAPMPSAIFGGEIADVVKIQKLGERRWIVAGDMPDQVWPVVTQFLADNGIAVAVERPEEGLIVTQWLDIADQSYPDVVRMVVRDGKKAIGEMTGRDQLMLRVEHGIRRGTSEVHVRYVNDAMREVSTWPEVSHIVDVEAELLSEVGAYFAADIVQPSISRVGRQNATPSKAVLERGPQGYLLLRLNVDFDRAWATVTQALSDSDAAVNEERRDEATFDVTVPGEVFGEEVGSLKGLIPGLDDFPDDQHVLIRIDPDGDGHVVRVLTLEGAQVSVERGETILVMLREFAA